MATRNITDIEELDSFWKSKYQKRINAYAKAIGTLQNKLIKLKARARVDCKFNELVRTSYPEIHVAIYELMAELGIKTKGIIRKVSKSEAQG